jgi:NAD(P)-dependent dehydrogenase (short-subunit alcohol dehydrogenase family)
MHFEEIGVSEHEPYIVRTGRYKQGRAMPDQIEIPESFPGGTDVAGKRVVITGSSRGLGRLLAHAFSQDGALVTLVARAEKDLKEVADALPGPALVLAGDVTDEEFNEAVADATVAEWGGVDVWICNAGISPIVAGPRDTNPAVWREVIDVNLTGAFLGARAAARVMGVGGRLIFTGSVLGERPRQGLTAYGASKAGLVGLAKGLALDLAPAGITVNVVAPGWFDSPLADGWKSNPQLADGVLRHTAQRRWGEPADLAGAYQFLASDASAFVTGTVLNVDGGYLLV